MNDAKRQAYQEKADAELRAWNARVDELLAKAAAAKAAGKIEYHDKLEKLRRQREDVGDKLESLKASSSEAWEEMKNGFEEAHRDLSTAFHTALAAFRNGDGGDTPSSTPPTAAKPWNGNTPSGP
jgi:hypothetical protein